VSDEPYTNLDLDTADELLIAAGRPELAKALRYQTQGVRNLVQGEWGQSFVNTLENLMDTRVVSVLTSVQLRLDEQIGIVQQLVTMVREANATAHEALTVAKAGAARLGKSEMDIEALKAIVVNNTTRLDVFEEKVAADIQERLARIETVLAARPQAREREHQAILDAITQSHAEPLNDDGHDGP